VKPGGVASRLARLFVAGLLGVVVAVLAFGVAWTARHRGVKMTSFDGPGYERPLLAVVVADLVLAPGDRGQSRRWQGYLRVDDSEVYEFWVDGTGFYRLFVDEIPVVDAWDDYGRGEARGRASLSRGLHKLRLEHRLPGGGGRLRASWASPRFARRSLAGALLH
jgi:hypothetical protein